jgi:hypothetical protein
VQELAADADARDTSPAPLLLPADEKERLQVLRQHIAELEAERARRGALNLLYPKNLLTFRDPHAQRRKDLTMLLTDLRSANTILSGGDADGDDGGDSAQGSPLTGVKKVSTYACRSHSSCTGTASVMASGGTCLADSVGGQCNCACVHSSPQHAMVAWWCLECMLCINLTVLLLLLCGCTGVLPCSGG